MILNISTEIEERLVAKAFEQGLTVEAFLESLLSGAPERERTGGAAQLPRWNLGVTESVRRIDIYDDGR